MTIVGSLDAGLVGDFDMLYAKSLLDFVAGIMMGAALGVGVYGSAAFTLVFQGSHRSNRWIRGPFRERRTYFRAFDLRIHHDSRARLKYG